MPRLSIGATLLSLSALAAPFVWSDCATAEMGPCRADGGWITCGSGIGAARVVEKTISPSGQLAIAWRLSDRAPNNVPYENDPNLENFVVRIADGAILAKSNGSYWDLGSKIAKAFLFTAWSPDSRLFVKVEQHSASASAELFSFDQNDKALGPFELVGIIKEAVLSQIQSTNDAADYDVVISSHPAITIDNHGLTVVNVQGIKEGHSDTPVYKVTLQLSDNGNSLGASVHSISPYAKPSIFITVH